MNSRSSLTFLLAVLLLGPRLVAGADYELTDPDLKVVPIDSSEEDSFLSIRADTMGRLFVGAREVLFVYEPNSKGGYAPRQMLYRFPDDSWIYDVEIRGNDLYAMTNRALYLIPGGVTGRQDLKAKRLIWGHPDYHPHQCFHGLAWGPDGDLYLSMGDMLVWYGDYNRSDHWGHWTFFSQPEGTKVPFTGVGGVLRCRPDGSNLQVVARGTRNSCGLVFDSRWNLFTHDNDHEGLPTDFVPGRLLHVTPHADFAWPRGWMASKTPDRADLLKTMFDGMGRGVPVGQSYYDEEYLPAKYRDNLLLARWGSRALTRYPLRHRGASFETQEHVLLQGFEQTRPVGVAVGRGGRIFVTLAYMAHNEGSPKYKSDLIMITRKDDPAHHPFEAYDAVAADQDKLWQELSNASSWPRRRAFVELSRRGADVQTNAAEMLAKKSAQKDPHQLATHLVWLAAAGGATDDALHAKVTGRLRELATGPDANLRHQSVRALAEFFGADESMQPVFAEALKDRNPQVAHAAIIPWFRRQGKLPSALIQGPAVSDDTYLRQAATQVLAKRLTVEELRILCAADDPKARLAGVLAAGIRLTMPPAIGALRADYPLQPWRDEKVYTVTYDNETVDLRTLGRVGVFAVAEHWRVGNHTAAQERLFQLLLSKLEDQDEKVRLQAAQFLWLLKDSRAEPLIEKVRTLSQRQRLTKASLRTINSIWTVGPFDDGGEGFSRRHPPEKGAIDLAAAYADGSKDLMWRKMTKPGRMFDFRKNFGPADGTSRYAYFRFETPRRQQVMLLPGSDDGLRIWNNGKLAFENDVIRGGLPLQDIVYLDLEAGSNDVLIRIRNVSDEHNLYLHYRALDSVSLTFPEKLDIAGLAQRLKNAREGDTKLDPKLLTVDWAQAIQEGNAERGRKLFSADGIGCAKCHAATADAAALGGPSLAASGKRFTLAYLVESILLPSEKIAPVFQGTMIVATDGRLISGLVVGETTDELVVLTTEAKRITIAKAGIEESKTMKTSPMPAGLIKDPQELRDLLVFLMQQK